MEARNDNSFIDEVFFHPKRSVLILFVLHIIAGMIIAFVLPSQLSAVGFNTDTIGQKIGSGIFLAWLSLIIVMFPLCIFFTFRYGFRRKSD